MNFSLDKLQETYNFMMDFQYGKDADQASNKEKYDVLSYAIMALIAEDWKEEKKIRAKEKKAYYFSAEFLMGRALGNNILNLGIKEEVDELLKNIGVDLNTLEDMEIDAALGNGGLGRLAACFLDSAASMDISLDGYGVLYEQGLFKQSFVDGFQHEDGDFWMGKTYPWAKRIEAESQVIHFKNQSVVAVPYDMPVIGYGAKRINTLRLWKSESIDGFDFNKFNNYEYDKSVMEKSRAEDITRVLYPNDNQMAGKLLRIKQQYFFVSASLKDLIAKYQVNHPEDPNFSKFGDYHALQLNDTHPVVGIPEIMRLFLDDHGLGWDEAWSIARKIFNFTNHTILKEAMEVWSEEIFSEVNPRLVDIIKEIDRHFVRSLQDKNYSEDKINEFRIVKNGQIYMANLALHSAKQVNGVAKLHTDILKDDVLKIWNDLYPGKIINKTNGVTPRRWLVYSNPKLASLITDLLGSDSWITNLEELKGLEKFQNDDEVLKKLMAIKMENKEKLAQLIKERTGIEVDTNSIFDVQVKRLHEYKRQLLNALHIVYLYHKLKENKDLDIHPRTFIFGAKAAPGYFNARAIIKFINEIGRKINSDPDVNGKIKVVFLENFNVSLGEKIYPATDISEQISTAGKEASGTGNMKFMINATPTLGTLDGANVEIVQEAGFENNYIFGARVEELMEIRSSYNPIEYYMNSYELKDAVDSLISGEFTDNGSYMFLSIYNSLVQSDNPGRLDEYFVLKDFEAYVKAQEEIDRDFRDKKAWAKKCLINLANSGKFSSDRTIKEYYEEIWK